MNPLANKTHLKPLTVNQAVKRAEQEILDERTDEQLGLYCFSKDTNIAMGKYFRFNNVNLMAGLSGHGKSYLLNQLTDDFLDIGEGGINAGIDFIPIIAHFCFEMSAYNEVLRSIAKDMGVSYGYLLSSEYNKETGKYNKITDEELKRVREYLEYYKRKNILFFETPSNIKVIYNTIEHLANHYEREGQKRGIKYKLVVNIDHSLLIDTLDEKSTLELMANVGKYAILIRKDFSSMVNLLGQLNNNIEDVRRLTNPALQYPQKSDIYAQSQLYNACDSVFVIHQPQLLKITQYGTLKLSTKGLMHFIKLKSRHGNVGSIWFKNDLSKGRIIDLPKNTTTEIEDKIIKEM